MGDDTQLIVAPVGGNDALIVNHAFHKGHIDIAVYQRLADFHGVAYMDFQLN